MRDGYCEIACEKVDGLKSFRFPCQYICNEKEKLVEHIKGIHSGAVWMI